MSGNVLNHGNINYYLNELAKEIKKRRGRKFHIEVLVVGGAALMLGEHEFRDGTVDIDAYVQEMASLKDCVFSVADKHNLPSDWFNTDFTNTASFSPKLWEESVYCGEFRQCLTVRRASDETIIAMKLVSHRAYSHDGSDIIGIIADRKKSENPIRRADVLNMVEYLYGETPETPQEKAKIPKDAWEFLDAVFSCSAEELAAKYDTATLEESENREIILDTEKKYNNLARTADVNEIIRNIRKKRNG